MITESVTTEGISLRFTKSGDGVYVLVMGMPAGRRVTMPAIDGAQVRRVRLVGADQLLEFSVEGGELTVNLPEQLPVSAVTVLDLGTEVRARLGPIRTPR